MGLLNFLKNIFKPKGGTHYLIEFRFQGYAKSYLKTNIWTASKKFKVKGITKGKVVPHISLVGPFKTTKQKELVKKFISVCKKYEWLRFRLNGFDHFDDRVIYVEVHPSQKLIEFRQELFDALEPIIYTTDTDYQKPFMFHSTIAFKDIQNKFSKIWSYFNGIKKPTNIKQTLIRATLMKGGKILYEYDFMQKKLLNRKQALNRKTLKKTLSIVTGAHN